MNISALLVVGLLGVGSVANAATLIDGSFSSKSIASGVSSYCYDGINTPGGAACAPSAWGGNSGIIASGASAWGGTQSVDGGSYAFVQISGILSQTFTAAMSHSSTLTWLDAGRSNQGAAQTYVVALTSGGVTTNLGTFTTEAGQQFIARNSSPFALIAGSTYTLSFTGQSTDDNTSFIDNVAVTSVPEPATWGLMLAGFMMVGAAARRRKTVVSA